MPIIRLQALYNLVTGAWPLLHRRSFEKLSGPKYDFWLVQTVGVVLVAVGAAQWLAANRKPVSPEIKLLSIGTAVGLSAIDITYGLKRRISRVYLFEAVVELAIVAGWLHEQRSSRNNS
jgi:hypothetical protein